MSSSTTNNNDNKEEGASYGVGQSDIGATTPASTDGNANLILRSWRERIQESSDQSRKIRGSNYVQLATVDPITHEPKCRTVVFRGFQEELPETGDTQDLVLLAKDQNTLCQMSCVMKMITDARSQKVDQVQNHPQQATELVWWLPHSNEQYRISGHLAFVGGESGPCGSNQVLQQARQLQWKDLREAARNSYWDPQMPGGPFQDVLSKNASGLEDTSNGNDNVIPPPPENFLLMLLVPTQVDYLNLSKMYRQVDIRKENDKTWSMQRLNP